MDHKISRRKILSRSDKVWVKAAVSCLQMHKGITSVYTAVYMSMREVVNL